MGGAMTIAGPAIIVGGVAAGGYLGYKAWNNEFKTENEQKSENWVIYKIIIWHYFIYLIYIKLIIFTKKLKY